MARIRSIHPALFTDEAFVSVPMSARVLLMGIWTEADDQGVFDWKPVTLKMRLMPVDNVDVPALLLELERAGQIRRFEQDGKQLGAIRNFCKWQRPKTPKYRDIKSPEILRYVASSYSTSEHSEPEHDAFLQKEEMPPQMEDEGGKREEKEEEEKKKSDRPAAKTRPRAEPEFQELKKIYPKRLGDYKWALAERKFNALVKTGVGPKLILDAAKRLEATQRKLGNIGTQFVPMPASWLGSEDFTEIAVQSFDEPGDMDWEQVVSVYRRTGHWSRWAGPDPDSPACRAPLQVLEKHGIKADSLNVQHQAVQ